MSSADFSQLLAATKGFLLLTFSRAESPPSDAHAAGASPRKGTALPQVLEAIEVNRPNSM